MQNTTVLATELTGSNAARKMPHRTPDCCTGLSSKFKVVGNAFAVMPNVELTGAPRQDGLARWRKMSAGTRRRAKPSCRGVSG
jgi:hypothetical protein